MSKKEVIDKIRNGLMSQKFFDWYESDGDFAKWILGDEDRVTDEQINKDIEKLFHL